MIYAVLNQKGGVGKTTTAVTFAHGLARHGQPTLLVDLDSQGNVCDALGLDKAPGLHALLVARTSWRRLVIPSGRDLLDVLPGDKTTVDAKMYLTSQNFREQALQRALYGVNSEYANVVFDLAPSVDVLHIAALVAADAFLVVTRLDHLAVVGVKDALVTLAALSDAGVSCPQFLGVLPTFWDITTNESDHQLAALAKTFGPKLWPPIPNDVKAREAPAYHKTLWEYAPSTRALVGVQINGNPKRIGGYAQALDRLLQEVTA